MFNQILKFALVSSVWVYLRTRWKRLVGCGSAILVVTHLHSEYLEYVTALPASDPTAEAAGEHLLLALVLKNGAIAMAMLVAIVPEFRRSRRRKPQPDNNKAPRPQVVSGAPRESVDSEPPQETADDGFDFLRHQRKLATRSDQIIRSKPSK